jgi:hypothetical protein
MTCQGRARSVVLICTRIPPEDPGDREAAASYAWYDLLWMVESGPDGRRRTYELADVLAIERYNLTRLVHWLEVVGLVTRVRCAEDGRAAYASITSKGCELRKNGEGL